MTRKLAGYASVNNLQHADRQLGLFSISEKYSPPTRSKHDIAILARLAAATAHVLDRAERVSARRAVRRRLY